MLWDISKTFFKIGITCWGGPAIVAQIKKEIVDKKKWINEEEFKETLGFCQMFPGPIAVQTSAHIGYRLRGVVGSFFAFCFYTLPTFIFMLLFSYLYFKFEKVPSFINLFGYLEAVIVAIIIDAIWSMRKIAAPNFKGALLILLCGAAFIIKAPVILVLFSSGLLGFLLFYKKGESTPFLKFEFRTLAKKAVFPFLAFISLLAVFIFAYKISPVLGELGFRMAKVNLLAFGGGYTAVALMFQESVLSTKWLTQSEFINGLALGQITPGPVIITATFIGWKIGGLWGALLATVAVLSPSYLILVFLSSFFKEISAIPFVKYFTTGLLCAFIGMLFQLLIYISSSGLINFLSIVLAAVGVVLLRLKFSPIFLVVLSLILSYFF